MFIFPHKILELKRRATQIKKIIEHQCTIGSGGLKSVALTKGGLVGLRPRYPEIGKKMFVIFQV